MISLTALTRFDRRPEVLCLNPEDLVDVWRDILWVGEESCRGPQAEALLEQIGARLGALEQQLPVSADRPRVAFLEWLQTVLHRRPLGSGNDPPCRRRRRFRPRPHAFLSNRYRRCDRCRAGNPVIAPCGYTAERARDEYKSMSFPEPWRAFPPFETAGSTPSKQQLLFAPRPAPRHRHRSPRQTFLPAIEVSREAETAILHITTSTGAARTASV